MNSIVTGFFHGILSIGRTPESGSMMWLDCTIESYDRTDRPVLSVLIRRTLLLRCHILATAENYSELVGSTAKCELAHIIEIALD